MAVSVVTTDDLEVFRHNLLNDLIKNFKDNDIDITGYIRNYSMYIIRFEIIILYI